ncbi:MAG: hypothetical protein IJZ88_01110 [Clostridia bacterium]|nr:hypothetical protein [Clostridia bacterium]
MINAEISYNQNPLSNILSSINSIFKDSDMILILAMVILLSQDGADKMLILALLYILS